MTTPTSPLPSRDDALAIVHEYTAGDSLRKHMLAVEAAMRAYAEKLGGDPEEWGAVGILHDLVLGQEGAGEQGERGVLVARRHDGAGQRHAAVDDELLHGR